MDKDLEALKSIFLAGDIDQEDYEDNLAKISEWEQGIRQNQDFSSWQESDVSLSIARQAKESYKDISIQLAVDRHLTDRQRDGIYAKQDAMIWLLSMISKDAKGELKTIHTQIRQALKPE